MNIATWNVNSLRARKERFFAWLAAHSPDVLCLQELKAVDEQLPKEEIAAAGYQIVAACQKTYNGVAILSRGAIDDVRIGLDDGVDDPQARLISAMCNGVRVISVYVPNGSEVGSEKYAYKLAWLDRLAKYLRKHHDRAEPLLLCGDFNVAPSDKDVAQPDKWGDSVLCHADARAALNRVVDFGLVDLFAAKHPEGGVYSWWDYRMLGFVKNDGLRIDMIYGTNAIAARCSEAMIDRQERKGKDPSDHAPVVVGI